MHAPMLRTIFPHAWLFFGLVCLLGIWSPLVTAQGATALTAHVAPASLGVLQDESETVRDFRKLFRRFEDQADQIEAIYGLRGIEDPEVVDALLPVLLHKDREVVRAAVQILGELKEEAPRLAVRDAFMGAKKDEEREGLLRAWAAGGFPVQAEDLKLDSAFKKLLGSRDWRLRLLAAEALVPALDAAFERVEPLLGDSEAAVRCGVLDALAKKKVRAVVPAAIAALEDSEWQVRASAAAALGRVRDQRSIEPLMAKIKTEEGRLLADYTTALERITGRSFGLDLPSWERFWTNFSDRFVIPTDEEIAKEEAARKESAKRYGAGTSYHGIETPSRAILFVVDVSGSMENWIMERDRYEEGKYPSWSRMDIVATELAATIEALESHVKFNVLSFATGLDAWRNRLVPANALQKAAAKDWVLSLEPIGGESAREQAASGLNTPADLSAGKTNTHGALMYALGVLDEKGKRVDDDDYKLEVDTVFFLTDGRPTVGQFIDPGDILRDVLEANAIRKLVLHVTAIGQFNKTFLRQLAELNGGQFVDLGS